MCKLRNLRLLTTLGAGAVVALVAAACSDQTSLNTATQRPNFWVGPPPQCPAGKWTGGGRIDPTGDASRTAPNDDMADETSGPQPKPPDPPPFITGKVTFGFNVFLGTDADQNCIVTKGEIEVNHHPAKTSWHVSIHHGVDDFDGKAVFAAVFPDNSGRGFCVVVGLPDKPEDATSPPPTGFVTARVNGQHGFEKVQFEGCDNDRGRAQSGRINGFHVDAMRWRSAGTASGDPGDTGLTYLTGGNIVEHGS